MNTSYKTLIAVVALTLAACTPSWEQLDGSGVDDVYLSGAKVKCQIESLHKELEYEKTVYEAQADRVTDDAMKNRLEQIYKAKEKSIFGGINVCMKRYGLILD